MKKRDMTFGAVISILTLPIISAQYYGYGFTDFRYGAERVIEGVMDFASPFFEVIIGDYSSSEFFFSKILLLILLAIVIKGVLDKTPIGNNNKKVSGLISIIVSILSIRFIQENNFFESVLIHYGVLGIAITTIIPLIIFFYFIHNAGLGTFGRKISWTIYVVTLGAIWLSRSSEIPEVANWIYSITIMLVVIFIFLDKTIHSYLGLSHLASYEKKINKKLIRKNLRELDELKEDYDAQRISHTDYYKEKKIIEKRIQELSKD